MTYEIVGLSSFKVQQLLHPLHNCKAMSSTSTKHALISKKYNSAVSLVATWKISALPSWLGNGCRRFLAVAWWSWSQIASTKTSSWQLWLLALLACSLYGRCRLANTHQLHQVSCKLTDLPKGFNLQSKNGIFWNVLAAKHSFYSEGEHSFVLLLAALQVLCFTSAW